MGEVECSIRLYGMLAGLGVCSLLVGGGAGGIGQVFFRAS